MLLFFSFRAFNSLNSVSALHSPAMPGTHAIRIISCRLGARSGPPQESHPEPPESLSGYPGESNNPSKSVQIHENRLPIRSPLIDRIGSQTDIRNRVKVMYFTAYSRKTTQGEKLGIGPPKTAKLRREKNWWFGGPSAHSVPEITVIDFVVSSVF